MNFHYDLISLKRSPGDYNIIFRSSYIVVTGNVFVHLRNTGKQNKDTCGVLLQILT